VNNYKYLLSFLIFITLSCEYTPIFDQSKFSLTLGSKHRCMIGSDSRVKCLGDNKHGQLDAPIDQFVQISAGELHTCGVTINNTVKCWGKNNFYQAQPSSRNDFKMVSSGAMHTCGLTLNGKAICWGLNLNGQSVAPEDVKFKSLTTGEQHSCGLTDNGKTYCWGDNFHYQSIEGKYALSTLSTGGNTNCGLTLESSKIVCWGENIKFSANPPGADCTEVKCNGEYSISENSYQDVSNGKYIGCAINENFKIECWGRGEKYAVTNPPTILCYPFKPHVQVPDECYEKKFDDSKDYIKVYVDKFQICAKTIDGFIDCWDEFPKLN
jgi:hypothetical protein